MSYSATAAAAAALHSIIDPNGGTCCTDGAGATPSTTPGATILSNKDATTARVATKIGTRSLTLATRLGILALRCDNAGIGSNSAGAALQYTTGTLDPANFSAIVVIETERRNKLVADLWFDAANTVGGAGTATVLQIAHDSGNIKRSNGTGFTANSGGVLMQVTAGHPMVFGISVSSGTVSMYRRDFYDASSVLIATGNASTITSSPAATGYTILGRNAANLFTQGWLYHAVVVSGALTAAQMKAEMDNVIGYLKGLSGSTFKTGLETGVTNPRLIVSGDSNSCGTGATQISSEWGSKLQADLIARGVTGLELVDLGAGSRQFTHLAQLEKVVADIAGGTSGKVLYACHCGENDINAVVNAAGLLTRAQSHFGNLHAAVPAMGILWFGLPSRTDISGGTLTNYDSDRASNRTTMLADTTLGGRINYWVDVPGDTGIGANGASNTTTNFNGDKVHYNSTGNTRVYSGLDSVAAGAQAVDLAAAFFLAPVPTTGGYGGRRFGSRIAIGPGIS